MLNIACVFYCGCAILGASGKDIETDFADLRRENYEEIQKNRHNAPPQTPQFVLVRVGESHRSILSCGNQNDH